VKDKGQALIIPIILMLLVVIIISSVAFFLAQVLDLDLVRIYQTMAVYAAQAGIFDAIVEYRNTGFISAETNTQITDNIYYSLGGAGMFFLADSSNTSILANRKLKDISMTNVNSTTDVTITHIQVSWTPDGGENLISIDLGRATVEWSGSASSGTNIDMTDFTIPADTTENDVWLDWAVGDDITSLTVTAILTFGDGSTVEITLLDEGLASDNALIITSTGSVVTSSDTWKHTIKAGYDVGTSEIISWKQSFDHL